jgi:hypothetical protein
MQKTAKNAAKASKNLCRQSNFDSGDRQTSSNQINRRLFKQVKSAGSIVKVGLAAFIRQTEFDVFAEGEFEAGAVAESLLNAFRVLGQVDQFFAEVIEDLLLLRNRLVVIIVMAVVIVVLVELREILDPCGKVRVTLGVWNLADDLDVHLFDLLIHSENI